MSEQEIRKLFDEINAKLMRAEELTDLIDFNLASKTQKAA